MSTIKTLSTHLLRVTFTDIKINHRHLINCHGTSHKTIDAKTVLLFENVQFYPGWKLWNAHRLYTMAERVFLIWGPFASRLWWIHQTGWNTHPIQKRCIYQEAYMRLVYETHLTHTNTVTSKHIEHRHDHIQTKANIVHVLNTNPCHPIQFWNQYEAFL